MAEYEKIVRDELALHGCTFMKQSGLARRFR